MTAAKKRLYLVQCNHQYGENTHLPYSAGVLWAYAKSIPEIAAAWDLAGLLYLREPIEKAVARLKEPDLVAISCYIWNWKWSLAFASAVKQRWPRCEIVVGGVHIPEASPAVLAENPQLDFAIYSEGEKPFADLLHDIAWGAENSSRGLIWREDGTGKVRVEPRAETVDIDLLPSPYLTGVFDSILSDGWKWQTAFETNRGCVWSCVYCAWGASALDKIRKLPMSRVLGELEWFAEHQSHYVECCDANFGMLPRDEEIVDKMIELKQRTGYPMRFRAAWAKNSNETIFRYASKLHKADMMKAVTLSVQSMDEQVNVLTRRKNIKLERFSSLVQQYAEAGIPTYTELILGLPGETKESFVAGVDQLLEAGQHDGLSAYLCCILPNTEMNEPAYRKQHGLVTAKVRSEPRHAFPDAIDEEHEVVIATSTMSRDDFVEVYMFAWAIQAFHALGLTQEIAKTSHSCGMPYRIFYTSFVRWIADRPLTAAGAEYLTTRGTLVSALCGGSWERFDVRFGGITWPLEEMSFLKLACQYDRFLKEMYPFLLLGLRWPDDWPSVAHLLEAQRASVVVPRFGGEERYAREHVWYGRKGNRAKAKATAAP